MSNINNNNSQIDFGLLPKNIPSLCIPRVFPNISEARIRKTFEDIFIGRIEKIDIIKGDKFNRVFVHLIWNNTPDALYVRNQVMTGKDVKVVYDGPWFWMVSASRKQTPPPQPPPPPQLSHKTDEFGRELRTTMQEQPLIKPILQRQRACFQPPPPPPPPMPLPMPKLQRQHACFQPPPPPTPPPMQMQRQDRRPESNYHHYHHQQPPQQQRKQPIKRYHHHQEQKQQLTDEFGRDIRRPQQLPPQQQQQQQQSSSYRPPFPVSENQKQKSWTSYDDDDEDDEEDLHKPVFIPQSPTSTPPSLRRKQIQEVQAQAQEVQAQVQAQVHIIEQEVHIIEQEVHIIEEEEEQEPSLTRSNDVDHPRQADMIQVKYDVVLPLKKIRSSTNNKKSKK